jgi:hypothetical protein
MTIDQLKAIKSFPVSVSTTGPFSGQIISFDGLNTIILQGPDGAQITVPASGVIAAALQPVTPPPPSVIGPLVLQGDGTYAWPAGTISPSDLFVLAVQIERSLKAPTGN